VLTRRGKGRKMGKRLVGKKEVVKVESDEISLVGVGVYRRRGMGGTVKGGGWGGEEVVCWTVWVWKQVEKVGVWVGRGRT